MSCHKDLENFFLNMFKESHMHVFSSLKQQGVITEEIEQDYLELVKAMDEVFAEKGGGFNMKHVRAKLPGNKWDPLYGLHREKLGLKPSDKAQRGQELVDLLDAAIDEEKGKKSDEEKVKKPLQ